MWAAILSSATAVVSALGKMFGWLRQAAARRAAKAEGQVEYLQETLDEVAAAKRARHRLRDPAYVKRLRDKYTRTD